MDQRLEQQTKKRRGCLVYAFIIGTVFLVFLLAGVLAGLNRLLAFTDKMPAPIPAVKLSQAEIDQVRQRVDSFKTAVQSGLGPQPLTLTAEEVNALIKTAPELESLRSRLWVIEMKGDQIKAQVSVLMAELGAAKFKDRYFNGYVTLSRSSTNGVVSWKPTKIETVNGRAVPQKYLDLIKDQPFTRSLKVGPQVPGALDWIQAIDVKDGKVVVVGKGK